MNRNGVDSFKGLMTGVLIGSAIWGAVAWLVLQL